MAALVLTRAAPWKALESTTSGTSGTFSTRWPRAKRSGAEEEAARAEAVAKRLQEVQWSIPFP